MKLKKVNILNLISYNYKFYDATAGVEYGKKALDLATKINFTDGIALAYCNSGRNYLALKENQKALENYTKALDINPNENVKIKIYTYIGNFYSVEGDYPKALNNYDASLKLAEKNKKTEEVARTLFNIATIYLYLGESNKYKEFKKKAFETYPSMFNPNSKIVPFSQKIPLKLCLKDTVNGKKAVLTLKKELNKKENQGSTIDKVGLTNALGDMYLLKKDYKKALETALQNLKINKKQDYARELSSNYRIIATSYFELSKQSKNGSDLKKAIFFINEAINEAKKENDIPSLIIYFELLSNFQKQYGDFKGALNSYVMKKSL